MIRKSKCQLSAFPLCLIPKWSRGEIDNIFKEVTQPFLANAKSEDTNAIFLDSDNDGDLDLYVTSGSKEFSKFEYCNF